MKIAYWVVFLGIASCVNRSVVSVEETAETSLSEIAEHVVAIPLEIFEILFEKRSIGFTKQFRRKRLSRLDEFMRFQFVFGKHHLAVQRREYIARIAYEEIGFHIVGFRAL